MSSSRLTIRLPLEAMRRLETRADKVGMSRGEAAKAAILEWSSLTEPQSGKDMPPGDPLPTPILLALKAGVSTATAKRWLEQCGGSIDQLEELSERQASAWRYTRRGRLVVMPLGKSLSSRF
jgi:hypothetical protein